MLKELPRTSLIILTSLPVSIAMLSIVIFLYRSISHWKMALALIGVSMGILSIGALAVISLGLIVLYKKSKTKSK